MVVILSRSATATMDASVVPRGEVRVLLDEFCGASEVIVRDVGQFEIAGGEEPQELGRYRRSSCPLEKVARLSDDSCRHQPRWLSGRERADALGVIVVVAVACRDQWHCVGQDHLLADGNSARRISSERSPRSAGPLKLPK